MENPTPENHNSNTFAEYGMLMLHELKRLNSGQEDLKKDLDAKFQSLQKQITEFKGIEKDVEELWEWKNKVTDVWSPPQMRSAKGEIYNQKGFQQKAMGVIIVFQVILTLIIAFKDKLF